MINMPVDGSLDQIREHYVEAFAAFDPQAEKPDIDVRFYPYIGINHTIRVRNGKVLVRIGEICREMPTEPQRALAFILVAKLMRRKVPKAANDVYNEFIRSDDIREKATQNKRERGRKIVTSSLGSIYDLEEIFDSLNLRYFGGQIEKPVLSWSTRKTYRILGHHDSTHSTVVISRSLDDAKVPRFLVEYIVFHEMLHIAHPTVHHNGRRYNHTPAFRRDEQKFKYFAEAERWIENNVRRLKRNARRK